MMRAALLLLNLVASLASVAWAIIALVRPAYFSGSHHGETFYARMYAARSIPFGLATGIIPFCAEGRAVAWLLITAAAIQTADVLIGVGKKERGMIVGASLAAIIHVFCGLAVL